MRNTYIKLYRKMLNSEIMKDPALLAVWVYLLLNAQWKARTVKFHGQWIDLQPGQLITGTHKIAEATGLTRDIVRRCLKDLSPTGKGTITRQSTHHGSIITICNWARYQNGAGESPTKSPNQSPPDAPGMPQACPTIQEGKKGKKGKKERNNAGAPAPPCPYSELQGEWNRLCQKSGLQRCIVFGDSAKRNAKNRWAHDWFREHWREIFVIVHKQKWCIENHASIDHPLRKKNAERYINEVLDPVCQSQADLRARIL